MANEYTGFNGTNYQLSTAEVQDITLGFKGTNVQTSSKQYLEIQNGFKGVSITLAYTGRSTKTQHFK